MMGSKTIQCTNQTRLTQNSGFYKSSRKTKSIFKVMPLVALYKSQHACICDSDNIQHKLFPCLQLQQKLLLYYAMRHDGCPAHCPINGSCPALAKCVCIVCWHLHLHVQTQN